MPADTGQILQQLFQILQATQPGNNATRALQRTQSGLSLGKELGILPGNQSWLNALSEGVPGMLRAAFPTAASQTPGLPSAWNTVSTQFNLPLSTLTSFHQAGMSPEVFSSMMTSNPALGQNLLSMSALTDLPNLGNLAQVYGASQAAAPAAFMALPADAAALGAASAIPALTGAAAGTAAASAAPALAGAGAATAGAAGAGAAAAEGAGILAALGLAAL